MPSLRLATYNVLSGRAPGVGLSQVPDPELLARSVVALDADLVALQEIDAFQERSGHRDQVADLVAALADHAGAHGQWTGRMLPTLWGTPSLTRQWEPAGAGASPPDAQHPAYGIGLVTRLPVQDWHEHRMTSSWGRMPMLLPTPKGRPIPLLVPDEPRAALAATVETELGPMTIASTHLSFLPPRGISQLRSVVRWLSSIAPDRPRLLLGDLNLPGAVPARLTGWARLAAEPTFPRHAPRVQLDHVLATGGGSDGRSWRVAAVHTVAGEVSDHLALVVDLTT